MVFQFITFLPEDPANSHCATRTLKRPSNWWASLWWLIEDVKKCRGLSPPHLLTCWETSAIFCKTQNLIKKLPSSFYPMVESLSTISIFHISFKFIQLYFWKSFCRLPPTFLPHLLSQKYSLIENGTLKASTLLIKILGVQKNCLK